MERNLKVLCSVKLAIDISRVVEVPIEEIFIYD
jgi:DNA-binding XRE family transcriptional regulator